MLDVDTFLTALHFVADNFERRRGRLWMPRGRHKGFEGAEKNHERWLG
jgi:hypothetical protein